MKFWIKMVLFSAAISANAHFFYFFTRLFASERYYIQEPNVLIRVTEMLVTAASVVGFICWAAKEIRDEVKRDDK